MDEKDVLAIVNSWRSEAENINAEILALKRAAEIVGGDLLTHSIELWEMKSIRLQRCAIDLQGLVIDRNFARILEIEKANV